MSIKIGPTWLHLSPASASGRKNLGNDNPSKPGYGRMPPYIAGRASAVCSSGCLNRPWYCYVWAARDGRDRFTNWLKIYVIPKKY